jgi:hypothetical protein
MDPLSFLRVYHPRFMCPQCLAAAMEQDPVSVREEMKAAIDSGHAEADHRACFACGETTTVLRLNRRL